MSFQGIDYDSADSEDNDLSGRGDVTFQKPAPETKQNASSNSARRLMMELNDVRTNPPPLCSAGLRENNLFEWVATIIGPPGSLYEGGVFTLHIDFSKDYPFRPPRVMFITKIYHCNISSRGNVCLNILKKNWSPALTVSSVLVSISSLLSDCNPHDPLVQSIAKLYLDDKKQHDQVAKEYTKLYAQP